jgi:hypothetical protein
LRLRYQVGTAMQWSRLIDMLLTLNVMSLV